MKKWFVGLISLTLAAAILPKIFNSSKKESQVDIFQSVHTTTPDHLISESPIATSPHSDPPELSINTLTHQVLDSAQPQELRKNALYTLTQKGSIALKALGDVATAPIGKAVSEYYRDFEVGLRVTAIETLDELAMDPSTSPLVKDTMVRVLNTQKEQTLTLLAQISLSGIESGRPGKVKRTINTLIQENSNRSL